MVLDHLSGFNNPNNDPFSLGRLGWPTLALRVEWHWDEFQHNCPRWERWSTKIANGKRAQRTTSMIVMKKGRWLRLIHFTSCSVWKLPNRRFSHDSQFSFLKGNTLWNQSSKFQSDNSETAQSFPPLCSPSPRTLISHEKVLNDYIWPVEYRKLHTGS
jgi:hypothetical protein